MKINTYSQFRQLKLSAVAAAVVLVGAGIVACSDNTPSATTVLISGAGNSLFVNVQMTATCSNGAAASGIIGATVPGEGIIIIAQACSAPILIEATGPGWMRPIGAPSDGSGDVPYDPAVNLPISNILSEQPEAGAIVTANPVTTAVANAVAPAGTALSGVTAAAVTTAKANVEAAMGLAAGDAGKDYRQPAVAAASSRMVAVAALAAAQVSSTGVVPVGVSSTKSLGRVLAEQIANTAKSGTPNSLASAKGVAAAINTGTNAIDVTLRTAVTGLEIDNDATAVRNLVVSALNNAGTTPPASVSAMNTAIAADTSATTVALKSLHTAETSTAAVENVAAKLVTDVVAAVASSTDATEKKTKTDLATAAAAKLIADTIVVIGQVATGTNTTAKPADMAVRNQAVAAGVSKAVSDDLSAAAANKIYAAPPTVRVNNAAAALVGNLQASASGLSRTSTAADVTAAVTAAAPVALNVVKAVATIVPPADTASQTTQAALQAALAAVAAKATTTFDPATQGANLRATVVSVQTLLVTALGNNAGASVGALAAIAQQAANAALGTGTVSFVTPPSVVTIPTITVTTTTTTSLVPTNTTTTGAATTTTTATATTTTLAFSGTCQVQYGNAIGYVTGVATSASCVSSVLNIDGGGATVSVGPVTLLAGKTSVAFSAALACDPFGSPPSPGAVTLTPCKQ